MHWPSRWSEIRPLISRRLEADGAKVRVQFIGSVGPDHWGTLSQSPIDISTAGAVYKPALQPLPLHRDYTVANGTLVDGVFNIAVCIFFLPLFFSKQALYTLTHILFCHLTYNLKLCWCVQLRFDGGRFVRHVHGFVSAYCNWIRLSSSLVRCRKGKNLPHLKANPSNSPIWNDLFSLQS